jgi:DNA-binding response OmpR family regulator
MRDMVAYLLHRSGFTSTVVTGEDEACTVLRTTAPSLILLDLDGDREAGLESCHRLRDRSTAPMLVLAPQQWQLGMILSLRNGADDFIAKPFHPLELIARVEGLLRRSDAAGRPQVPPASRAIARAGLLIDPERHEVCRGGEPVRLTPLEFKLLYYLMRHEGQVSTAQNILERVWGWEDESSSDAVKVAMSRLRRKIEPDPKQPRWLHTVAGVGYTFRPAQDPVALVPQRQGDLT